jgi:tRNA nucleotidyltransferase (CCA-adding enzyme)
LPEPIPFNPAGTASLTSIDFVTARTEFYRHPSALPEVTQSSIQLDLHRRDFTINTLALRLTPHRLEPVLRVELLDFYNGQADLEAKMIRVLHSLSFVEDPTRMLRAGRLMARLDFNLEERTAELLTHALDLLSRVTAERIYHELVLIFHEYQPAKALQQIDRLGILSHIHPALTIDDWLVDRLIKLQQLPPHGFENMNPSEPVYHLGLLLFRLSQTEQAESMERLNLKLAYRKIINQVREICARADEIAQADKPITLYYLLEHSLAEARLIVWLGSDDEVVRRQLVRFQTELQHVAPLITGAYIKQELQIPPGPIYGKILEQLRDARLDGRVNTLEDERLLALEII